ncbi:hypothetical protein [Streptomyces sp. KHY 26]|uniref:hypothetical protein n=1 Tax=Streptomyces sp. KHY 26 TaxID=3097359 RepID=UPI00376ED827
MLHVALCGRSLVTVPLRVDDADACGLGAREGGGPRVPAVRLPRLPGLLRLGEADPALEGGHQSGVVAPEGVAVLARCGAAAELGDEVLLGAAARQPGFGRGAAHGVGARGGQDALVLLDRRPVAGPDAGRGLGGGGAFVVGTAHGGRGRSLVRAALLMPPGAGLDEVRPRVPRGYRGFPRLRGQGRWHGGGEDREPFPRRRGRGRAQQGLG